MKFDFTITLGTLLMISSLIGSLAVIWFRFGRNAEKVFGDLISLGGQIKEIARTLTGIKELLTRHDVRLEVVEQEVKRVETRIDRRLSRLENGPNV